MLERPTPSEEIRPTLKIIRENIFLEGGEIVDETCWTMMRNRLRQVEPQLEITDCHALLRNAGEDLSE